MKSSNVKMLKFSIMKLFGRKNIVIDFENNVKIFVGENGIGKTTILNILFYSITKNYSKLRAIDFEKIELLFSDNQKLTLEKKWIEPRIHIEHFNPSSRYYEQKKIYNNLIINEIIDINYEYSAKKKRKNNETTDKWVHLDVEDEKLMRDSSKGLHRFSKSINEIFKDEVLYFPTYRRIEEELYNLGYNIDNKEVTAEINLELIKFGMKDVKSTFNEIEDSIKNSTLIGYSQVTGGMISHLVHGHQITQEMLDKIKESDTLNVVLDRVGSYLNDVDKNKIRELMKSNELFDTNKNPTYNPLIFFLYNLIENYEEQKIKDDSIKNFTRVCNSYLVNKLVRYDESKVKIDIIDKNTSIPIELGNLSSGEKQIVSLFTRIYLTSEKNFIVLFDEPELSLSIEWQEKLLEDVLGSGRCSFMVAVTHSPFVYNNSLEEYTESMELCISEVE